jgi:hypothetical protein
MEMPSLIETLKDKAPTTVPNETCPMIDRISVLADAISSDIGMIRESLDHSKSSTARTAGFELIDTEANLATLRLQLEELRHENARLRTLSLYWYQQTKTLAEGTGNALIYVGWRKR